MSDVEPGDHPRREAIVEAAVQAVTNEMAEMDGVCTFDELFAAMKADLIKPLPALITPIQSPIYINDEEELLQLHPSPVASLEEPSMTADKDIISTPAQTQSKRELSQEKNVLPKKKVASSISVKNDNDKENVKRHSTEDYSISHKKIRDGGDRDWGNFKIPHKPVQGQSSSHSSHERSKPLWDNDRSKSRHPSSNRPPPTTQPTHGGGAPMAQQDAIKLSSTLRRFADILNMMRRRLAYVLNMLLRRLADVLMTPLRRLTDVLKTPLRRLADVLDTFKALF